MAHALYREYVPLGSVENSAGAPYPLNPATSSATPKGRDMLFFLSEFVEKSSMWSEIDFTHDSTGIFSLYVNQWC